MADIHLLPHQTTNGEPNTLGCRIFLRGCPTHDMRKSFNHEVEKKGISASGRTTQVPSAVVGSVTPLM